MAKKKTTAKPAVGKSTNKKAAEKSKPTNKDEKTPAKKTPKKTVKKSTAKKSAPKKTEKKSATTPPAKTKPAKHKPAKKAATKRKGSSMKNAKTKPAVRSKPKKTARLATVKMPPAEKSVEGYLSTLNGWRQDAVATLRTMIRKAAPAASEKVQGSQPVYEHHGPFAWIKAHTKHVKLGFWRGVELPDPRKLLQGTGEKMRHIKLSSLKDAGKKELQELVRIAARLNEIKGNPTRAAKGKAKHK